jgi:hypothetical protein
MADFLSIPKNQTGYYVLVALMALFIIMPIEVPHELAGLIDTNLGKIVLVVIVLNMFVTHPVAGAVAGVAAYELLKRSTVVSKYSKHSSAPKFVPTEQVKTGNLNRFNQFPITVEELVIKQKIPYSFNISNPSVSSHFVPNTEDIRNAGNVISFSPQ